MVSTVKSRPNHYATLGLSPDASDEDIARAFARELSAPRAFGGLAEVGIAYETLRDPAKRRAYDETLGIRREPERRHFAAALAGRGSAHFMGAGATVKAHEPHVEPVRSSAPAEAKPAPPVAAAPQPQPVPEPTLEQLIGRLNAVRQGEERAWRHPASSAGWSRTTAIVGALVVGTMLLGAWAGLEARDDGDVPAERSASIKLPPAKPVASVAQAQPEAAAPAFAVPRPMKRAISQRAVSTSAQRMAEISQMIESGDPSAESASAPAEPAPAEVVAASMPLPNAVIARTIERIGYACGAVASTSAVEGASGVYKVTCTSGQSYQASPVRRRYRFRRLR